MIQTATIGVLALQGDFREHCASFQRLGVTVVEVRTPSGLDAIDALIIPGGESTSMAKLMDAYGLREPVQAFGRSGRPMWGTCAGLILMASDLLEDRPVPLGLVDMVVQRNGFGRQADSFETTVDVIGMHGGAFPAVFIRAPRICEVGPDVEIISTLPDGSIVAIRQGNLVATAFHPELTLDSRMHQYFLESLKPETVQ